MSDSGGIFWGFVQWSLVGSAASLSPVQIYPGRVEGDLAEFRLFIYLWGASDYEVIFMDKEKTAKAATEPAAKKKGGRKPMTAEEKAVATKGGY